MDETLRRHERGAATTGDATAYLRARMRSGELSVDRLMLAAYAGSTAAWDALWDGSDTIVGRGVTWVEQEARSGPNFLAPEYTKSIVIHRPPCGQPPVGRWLKSLSRWGKDPLVLATEAISRHLVCKMQPSWADPYPETVNQTLDHVLFYLLSKSLNDRAILEKKMQPFLTGPSFARRPHRATLWAGPVLLACYEHGQPLPADVVRVIQDYAAAIEGLTTPTPVDILADPATLATAVDVACARLVRWALTGAVI